MIFPEICLPTAMEKSGLSDAVSSESASIAEHPQRYIMKFKIIEIYEDLKNFVKR